MIRTGAPLVLASVLLSGCLGTSVPTQQHPSCSWDSNVPANATAICAAVYTTLNSVAHAEEAGDTATMNRLIRNASVRRKIMGHSHALRAEHVRNLHVVPSITLDQLHSNTVGAGFYLNGDIDGGRVNSPLTVELQVVGMRAVIIHDQPGQEW